MKNYSPPTHYISDQCYIITYVNEDQDSNPAHPMTLRNLFLSSTLYIQENLSHSMVV